MRRQSEHFADYRAALDTLEALGLVYPSFESRAEIARLVAERDAKAHWPRDPDGAPLYPGTAKQMPAEERARRIAAGEPYALRLDMHGAMKRTGALTWAEVSPEHADDHDTMMVHPEAWGDVVLARKETPTSYHLSVVVDDAAQGVTHVVRGEDSASRDQRASSSAGTAWASGAALPSSSADPRRRGPQALEIDAGDAPARVAGAGRDARRRAAYGGDILSPPRPRHRPIKIPTWPSH